MPLHWRLPFDGRFIGSPFGCSTHANIKDTIERFHTMRMPVHEGQITDVAFHIRYNKKANGGYSDGDGGRLNIEARRNRNGQPDMGRDGRLGRTDINGAEYAPLVGRRQVRQAWKFQEPVPVEDGQTVHFMFRQRGPGAVSHNVALYWGVLDPPAGPYFVAGPTSDEGFGVITTKDGGLSFSKTGRLYSAKYFFWSFEIGYADGTWKGSPGFAGTSQTIKPIGGRWMARQRMTINPIDVTINSLWLRAWWRDQRPSEPLIMRLSDGDGTLLADVEIAPDLLSEGDSTKKSRAVIPWVNVPLPQKIQLQRGRTVDATLMSLGDYLINAHVDGTRNYGFKSVDSYDCLALYSSDGGDHYVLWDADKLNGARDDFQLPLAFECDV